MKRLYIISCFLIIGLYALGQVPTITTRPSEIDALTENVTFTFDVTGTDVEGLTDVYIWAWSPQLNPSEILLVYDQGSPSWGSISSNAKLSPVDGQSNIFEIVLPLTVTRGGVEVTFNNVAELFGVADTPGKIKEFGFLLRSQDGSKQTPGDLESKVTLVPLEFGESYFRVFPAKVSNKDVVSTYVNLNLIDELDEEDYKLLACVSFTADISLKDASGEDILVLEGVSTVSERDMEYAVTFIPARLGEFPDGKSIDDVVSCSILFKGQLKISESETEEVESSIFEIEFQDLE